MQPLTTENQSNSTVTDLLQLIDSLVCEFHQAHPPTQTINLDSSFERDLGLDSLARVELISRVEKKFKLALPERTYTEAESARDLLRAIHGSGKHSSDLYQGDTLGDVNFTVPSDTNTIPDNVRTLIDVLNWHVSIHPNRPHITIYTDEGDGGVITYMQLKQKALLVAGGLQQRGLKPAEPVVLMLPSCPDYFYSFFGILLAGGIPVPIYPPVRASQLEDHVLRHMLILENCRASTFITVAEAKKVAHLLKSLAPCLQHVVTTSELISSDAISMPPVLTTHDIAFLQYTSGSTGNPKGVVLTHANLLANIRAMGQVVKAGPKDVFVSWLPLYHDMGLIGAWLGSLYYTAHFVVMPPLSFLARPERWLWAIHQYHGTLSASPNFGYEYCLRRLNDSELKGLDLSSWRAAFNGAEPVSPETLNSFSHRFKIFGFDQNAMMPVYGLAESTVGLTFPPLQRGALIDSIERNTFMQTGMARPAAENDEHALRFVSSGPPLPNHQIRIIDPAGHELPERQQGRLEFHGPSATSGYYRDTQKTQNLFDNEWLDTGDLAYITNGELYVTGRVKDIIIKAGRNIYPHELEEAIGNIADIRTGRVAVFGSEDKSSKTERLIVVAETHNKDKEKREKLHTEINSLAIDLVGTPPDEIILAPPGTVLKTSSGKIRRAASRELFENGGIGKKQAGVFLQVARIALTSLLPQLRRAWHHSKETFYAIYCWFIYFLLAPIVWVSTMFLPSFSLRWAITRNCAKLFAKLTLTKITVNGLENIPSAGQPYVLVSNHASYLDSYALIATLPGYFRFIAKAELAQHFYNRIPLKNIHTEFVDRYDTSKSLKDTHHLEKVLKTGEGLIFFAEGTFTRIPGLRPFHLGAFAVSAKAEVPIIPVAIRGTRSILRSESWYPHHGSINIDIGEAIDPVSIDIKNEKDSWHIAIELRNRCRDFIFRHCGEPDLEHQGSQFVK